MDALQFLEKETKNKTESHAYLFVGSRREADRAIEYIVRARNILPIDVSKISPEELKGKAGEIKIDDVRQLLRDISRSPAGENRLVIIYNCEKLNASSGNILLKSLEEPAGPVIFVLTANSLSVLPTIKSRCRVITLENSSPDNENDEADYLPEIKKGFFWASKLIEEIVKGEKVDELFSELSSDQRKKMLLTKKACFAKNLEKIEEARKRINQNGNQRLILECLILKIGSDL